jgi:hypothetical protein
MPVDPRGAAVDHDAYYAALKAWVKRGGNLVLTDDAVNALADLQLVKPTDVQRLDVYLPFANFTTFDHAMSKGLRPNARQLVESAVVGYGIQGIEEKADSAPMTVVNSDAFHAAGGTTVGTTSTGGTGEDPFIDAQLDDRSLTSVGELKLGEGKVRIVGGALPTPTEENDHRFGLRDYGLTYSGTFLMENAIRNDAGELGALRTGANPYGATNALPPAIRRNRRYCHGARTVRIRLRTKVRRVRVTVNGKRRKGRVHGRTVRVRVRGDARIRVVGRTKSGRRVRARKRSC